MSKIFRILAIDGGGLRGVYAVHLLKRIEEELGPVWDKAFDLIVGTSTGSMIAGGLACGITATRGEQIFLEEGKRIFRKRWFTLMGLIASRYRNCELKRVLEDTLGDRKLADVKTPLMIPATDIGNGCVHMFRSAYHADFAGTKDLRVVDAIMASCAAPTYFDPHLVGEYLLADGGLWANDPSLAATLEARQHFGVELEDVRVLSIGTGSGRRFYSQATRWRHKVLGWGLATRWEAGKCINMILNLQVEKSQHMLGVLLKPEQLLRFSFTSDMPLAIDDVREIPNLISKADYDFEHGFPRIRDFLILASKEISPQKPAAQACGPAA
ncbi:MAG: CBASS cGAMP-activated phospholipase [Planctomycetaceae bacterium]|nr:patatin-like phospholipase family protein [Planctomycetaceae bacterium]